jgi:hypothetical protein
MEVVAQKSLVSVMDDFVSRLELQVKTCGTTVQV